MHWAVVGATGCGKSRGMRERIVPQWISRGRPVVVLDPLSQPWGATYQTADPYDFLATMQRSVGCIGVWDEAGTMLDSQPRLRRDLQWLATVSRNSGHMVYFLSQRFFLLPRTFRYQCTRAMVFNLTGADAAEAAKLYGRPELEPVLPALVVGECIVIRPMERPVKTRLFA